MSIEINMDGFNQKMRNLAEHTRVDSRQIFDNEARLLVEEIVSRTTPRWGPLGKRIRTVVRGTFRGSEKGGGSIDMQAYYRSRRYGPRKKLKKIPVRTEVIRRFLDQQLHHRGWFAASFMAKGNPLHASKGIPAAVKIHAGQGDFHREDTPAEMRITIVNQARFMGYIPKILEKARAIVEAAVATREYKMHEKLEKHIKSGVRSYWK